MESPRPPSEGPFFQKTTQNWLLCESDKQRTSGGGWNWFKEILGVARLQHIGLYPPSLVGEGDRKLHVFSEIQSNPLPIQFSG